MSKAIAITCNSGFLEGAEALLRSINKHHQEIKKYCFVPADDFAKCISKLDYLAEINCFPRSLRNVPDNCMAAAARVFAATLPERKVCYMDADTIVCGSIDALFEAEKNKVLAVADDSTQIVNNLKGHNFESFNLHFPNVAQQKGCNSGVWGLNTEYWRDLPELFEEIVEHAGLEYEPIIDQPILNVIFHSHLHFLPRKYNAHCLFDNPIPKDVRVIHFTSKFKPWMPSFPKHEPAYWYWLKHGTPQADPFRLSLAWAWIMINTPKRLLGRSIRRRRSSR